MNPFEFVIAVVVVTFAYKLMAGWMRSRSQMPVDEPERAALLKKLADVEERVRVLERIVTDDRFDLKQQFRDLEGQK